MKSTSYAYMAAPCEVRFECESSFIYLKRAEKTL